MSHGPYIPRTEAHAQNHIEWQLLQKAQVRHDEKDNTRSDCPECSLAVIGYQLDVTRMIQMQPHKHQSAG